MHTPGGVANIWLVAENAMFLMRSTRMVSRCMIWEGFHLTISFLFRVFTPEMTQLCLVYILRSVTSLLYSHRFDSIQILNSKVHVLCLPPFWFVFMCSITSCGIALASWVTCHWEVLCLESTVTASRAPGTTEAYRRAFLRWKEFASSKMEICAFLANSEHVALYL